jgi:chromosome partitioning protein
MPEHGSPARSSSAPPRIIALINQKGGVGKTTTTVNLAAALAAAGRSTLVVDLDPQAHATLSLGIDPAAASRSVYDLLLDWDDDPAAALLAPRPNLSLIPSETDLAAAEAELTSAPDRHRRLARALAPLHRRFEFILIDCPPSLGMLTLNGLAAAREVLIPMQAHFLALQGVSKLLETVKLVRAKVNPDLAVAGIVLCMHDAQASHTQEVVSDLVGFFDQARDQDVPWRHARVFRPPIRRNIKLAECPSFGQTIFDYAPTAPGAADYRALAEAILAAAPQPGGPAPAAPAEPPQVVIPAAQPAAEAAR